MTKLISGINDLATVRPDLVKEWHPENNPNISPYEVTKNSHKKVWWLGSCGHEWIAPVADRTRGRGCPICKSKKVVAGINDLATTHPHIAKEWHLKLNDKNPTQVLPQSNKSVWWICEKGHEYKTSPAHRTARNSGCPICSNKQILIGTNDLATTHPEIALQWHPNKNTITPQQVTIGSDKKVWWKCKLGHEWEARVYSRKTNGCPYCSGNMIWIGFNDLKTTHPEIAAEWHPSKNKELSPIDVSAGSNQNVWWLGKCGHEWKAAIHSRSSGCGCPVCNEERKTSFPENAIFFYLKSIYPDTIKSYKPKWLVHMEMDIYIPSLQIAIEYDGQAWHNNVDNDLRKGEQCKEHGIRLIRIREPKCPPIEGECIRLTSANTHNIENAIQILFADFLLYPKCVDIDIDRDRGQIFDIISHSKKKGSLVELAPDIAKEWHPKLNGSLMPEHVSYKSNKKYWWKCEKGHEWEDTCNHRSSGRGCPYCSNKRVLAGFNDLKTLNPSLAAQWHPTKNGDLTPDSITAGSSQKVWWSCDQCGYEWEAVISSRNKGCGCPECYKQKRNSKKLNTKNNG